MQERFTFGKPFRLRRQQDFQRVLRRGRRVARRGVVVYVDANGLAWSRLGIRVSRRAGNAVERNRIKRWIREVFRVSRSQLPVGVDVVCVIRSPVDHAFEQWREILPDLIHAASKPRGRKRSGR